LQLKKAVKDYETNLLILHKSQAFALINASGTYLMSQSTKKENKGTPNNHMSAKS
jgi:hypothetical protein